MASPHMLVSPQQLVANYRIFQNISFYLPGILQVISPEALRKVPSNLDPVPRHFPEIPFYPNEPLHDMIPKYVTFLDTPIPKLPTTVPDTTVSIQPDPRSTPGGNTIIPPTPSPPVSPADCQNDPTCRVSSTIDPQGVPGITEKPVTGPVVANASILPLALGIAVGGAMLIALIFITACYCRWRKKNNSGGTRRARRSARRHTSELHLTGSTDTLERETVFVDHRHPVPVWSTSVDSNSPDYDYSTLVSNGPDPERKLRFIGASSARENNGTVFLDLGGVTADSSSDAATLKRQSRSSVYKADEGKVPSRQGAYDGESTHIWVDGGIRGGRSNGAPPSSGKSLRDAKDHQKSPQVNRMTSIDSRRPLISPVTPSTEWGDPFTATAAVNSSSHKRRPVTVPECEDEPVFATLNSVVKDPLTEDLPEKIETPPPGSPNDQVPPTYSEVITTEVSNGVHPVANDGQEDNEANAVGRRIKALEKNTRNAERKPVDKYRSKSVTSRKGNSGSNPTSPVEHRNKSSLYSPTRTRPASQIYTSPSRTKDRDDPPPIPRKSWQSDTKRGVVNSSFDAQTLPRSLPTHNRPPVAPKPKSGSSFLHTAGGTNGTNGVFRDKFATIERDSATPERNGRPFSENGRFTKGSFS